jgi:hypothetical protein
MSDPTDVLVNSLELAKKLCKAMSGSTGVRCSQIAMDGRDYCRYHGGLLPVGENHPNFKSGKYSKYMKYMQNLPGLRDKFIEFAADLTMTDLCEEVAQLRAMLADVLEQKQGSLDPQDMIAIFGIIEQIGRQVERQARLQEMQSVPAAQVQDLLRQVIDIIVEEVEDPDIKRRLADRLSVLQM